jgi:two-component system nitrate/nitrite response regulator NarL
MQTQINTIIVGPCSLLREGIEFTICRTRFKITTAVQNVSSITAEVWTRHHAPSVTVVLGTDLTIGELQNTVTSLRAQRASECIVVIYEGVDSEEAVLQAGANALLPAKISPDVLVMSLNLLMARDIAMMRLGGSPVVDDEIEYTPKRLKGNEPKSARPSDLTKREIEVLRAVALGESNKHIANRLSMREPTVKSHMRLIMRKIGSKNRTQAATWAISHGLADRPGANAITSIVNSRNGDARAEVWA